MLMRRLIHSFCGVFSFVFLTPILLALVLPVRAGAASPREATPVAAVDSGTPVTVTTDAHVPALPGTGADAGRGARPFPTDSRALLCPADGVISQFGTISDGKLLQAKGIRYSFDALAGEAALPGFEGGQFMTIYLAPRDYHRVHLPIAGQLKQSVAIPGALFSVNGHTEGEVEGLFCRNERLVMSFSTDVGRMLVIMVGALIVASIETTWPGPRSPYRQRKVSEHGIGFARGDEIGRFLLGSTVILAFERDTVRLGSQLAVGRPIRMGEPIAEPLVTRLHR